MKPTFSVKYLSRFEVQFTDTYAEPGARIVKLFTGDGTMLGWDTADQTVISHTYKNIGVYIATAISKDNVASEPFDITIGSEPSIPDSWWKRLISWLKRILKIKEP